MRYVEGFLLAVPQANKTAYQEMTRRMAEIYKELGALRIVESWEDDVPEGKVTSFPMAVQRQSGEKVVFAWIEWPSRAVRDEANARLMEHPGMQQLEAEMTTPPFDGARMVFGGFDVWLDESA